MNAPADIRAWLVEQEHKELLRFITCGSVDDGKSTLIGRLLYETKQIFDDQLAALEADSKRHGTQGQKIDLVSCSSRPIRVDLPSSTEPAVAIRSSSAATRSTPPACDPPSPLPRSGRRHGWPRAR